MDKLCSTDTGVHSLGNDFDFKRSRILAERSENAVEILNLILLNNENSIDDIGSMNDRFKSVLIVCTYERNGGFSAGLNL